MDAGQHRSAEAPTDPRVARATWGWDSAPIGERAPGSARVRRLAATAFAAAALTAVAAPHAKASPAPVGEWILQADSAATARSLARSLGGTVRESLPIARSVVVRLPAGKAHQLAGRPGVRVSENAAVTLAAYRPTTPAWAHSPYQSPSISLGTTYPFSSRADATWTAFGRSGEGVGVAVVDSGVADSPELGATVAAHVVVNPNVGTGDGLGHGTHVAGIIAGHDAAGHYVGIAPNARIVDVKVTDGRGRTNVATVVRSLQYIADHAAALGIRVVNLSLASTATGTYLTDPIDTAVEALWRRGLVVVAAAGNGGPGQAAVSHAPGNDPFVITVGASDDQETISTGDDEIAPFSARGVTLDGVAKPDIYAPGVDIASIVAPGALLPTNHPTAIKDGHLVLDGTSMSAAVVSGAAALLLEQRPDLTPDQVKTLVTSRAQGPAALRQLDAVGMVAYPLEPTAANQGLRVAVAVDAAPWGAQPAANWSNASWSSANWANANWSSANWSSANWSAANWSSANWSSANWANANWAGSLWQR